MAKKKLVFQEELELDIIREEEKKLHNLQCQLAELPKKLDRERKEKANLMPPIDMEDRILRRRHEEAVTRGEVANITHAQNRSLALLFLLLVATIAVIWWGIKLMQG